jgi:Domain of unknown function (DUF4440)
VAAAELVPAPAVAAGQRPDCLGRRWLDVIKAGRIHYRDVELKDVSVRFIGSTAIVLTTLQLGSVVDGNEVSNPFVVTEVYVKQAEVWTLASMSFTQLRV